MKLSILPDIRGQRMKYLKPSTLPLVFISAMMLTQMAASQWTNTTNNSLVYIGALGNAGGGGLAFDAIVDKDKCLFLVTEYGEKVHLVKFNPDGYMIFEADLSDNPGSKLGVSWHYGGGCRLVSDGDGGAIVAWMDHRNSERDTISGGFTNNAIRAQRILKDGTVDWSSSEGIIVADESSGMKMWYGLSPRSNILSDFHGGAYLYWLKDSRSVTEIARYQHIRSDGRLQFDISGKELYDGSVLQGLSNGDIVEVDSASMAIHVFVYQPIVLHRNNLYLVRDSNGVVQNSYLLDANDFLEWRGGTIWKSRTTVVDSSTTLVTFSLLKQYPEAIWDTTYTVHDNCYMWSYLTDGIRDYSFFDPCSGIFQLFKSPGISFRIPIPYLTTYARLLPSSGTYYCFNANITECVRLDEKSWSYWPQSLKILDEPPNPDYRLLSDNNLGAFLIFNNEDDVFRIQHINADGSLGMRRTDVRAIDMKPSPSSIKCFVYPQPAAKNARVMLEIVSETANMLLFRIYDLLGRVKKEFTFHVQKGRNSFVLDIEEFTYGLYKFFALKEDGSIYATGTVIK